MSNQAKIIRLPTVEAMTGLPRSTIYHHMKCGTFPKQLKLGVRGAGWVAEEVQAWIGERMSSRQESPTK